MLRDLAQEYGARVCILAHEDHFDSAVFGRAIKYQNISDEVEIDFSDWDRRRIEYIKAWKPKRILFADRFVYIYIYVC